MGFLRGGLLVGCPAEMAADQYLVLQHAVAEYPMFLALCSPKCWWYYDDRLLQSFMPRHISVDFRKGLIEIARM
jgi:hypothetical protein